MRLPEFILLVCLLSSAIVDSDAMGRMNMLAAIDGAPKRSSNQTLEAASNRKYSKRLNFRSVHLSKSEKYNDTSADNKRMVPTGPNPLHNK